MSERKNRRLVVYVPSTIKVEEKKKANLLILFIITKNPKKEIGKKNNYDFFVC